MSVRIIIADGQPLQRIDLKDVLTRRGYQVIGEAVDGAGVIAMSRLLRPDLVIMDSHMPDMDGMLAAGTLVREKIAPVIFLTAYTDQALVKRARDIGVSNYLVKPLHESEVIPAVEMVLSHHRQMYAMEEQIRLLSAQLETHMIVERYRGTVLEQRG